MATIAIIGALEKEIMQIKEELSNVCMVQEAGLNVVAGGLDGLTVVATTAGMGTVNAAAATPLSRRRMPIVLAWRARRLPMSQLKMVSIAWCCALSAIIVTRRTMRFATVSSTCSSMPVPRVALRSISSAALPLRNSASICKNLRPRSVHGRFH